MLEPKRNDISRLSQTSVSSINSKEGQQTFYRKLVGFTITVEKVDRLLADLRAQIEKLRRYRMNLVRVQLAGIEAKWKGE